MFRVRKMQEEEAKSHEAVMGEVRHKYNAQIELLSEQLETMKRNKAMSDKSRQTLEGENVDLANEVKALAVQRTESERRRKQSESQAQELSIKFGEGEKMRTEIADKMSRLVQELEVANLQVTFHCDLNSI